MTTKDWKILEEYGITPDGLTVGGSLDLHGTSITTLPDNLTVGGWIDLHGTSITTLPDNLTVGGSLDLHGTSITTLPDNLTVGGYLDLSGTSITTLPDNLTVGGYLDLRGTSITTLPKSLKVGSSIQDKNGVFTSRQDEIGILAWTNKHGEFIKVDGIFSKVLSIKGEIIKTQQWGSDKISYIVTDGDGNYSHGETIKEARQDLLFKIGNRSKEDYKEMTLDSELKFEESIVCYRVLTGACKFGVKEFLKRKNVAEKPFKIQEIIDITDGEYEHETFKNFFITK